MSHEHPPPNLVPSMTSQHVGRFKKAQHLLGRTITLQCCWTAFLAEWLHSFHSKAQVQQARDETHHQINQCTCPAGCIVGGQRRQQDTVAQSCSCQASVNRQGQRSQGGIPSVETPQQSALLRMMVQPLILHMPAPFGRALHRR